MSGCSLQGPVLHYNHQADQFDRAHPRTNETLGSRAKRATSFVGDDPSKISWKVADYKAMARGDRYTTSRSTFGTSIYRPFYRQRVNFDRKLNNRVYQLPRIFPTGTPGENLAICMPNGVTKSSFGVLMVDALPALHVWPEGTLVFPLYRYPSPTDDGALFSDEGETSSRRPNINEAVIKNWSNAIGMALSQEEVFYFIYGVLHSPAYRERFEADLKKQIPRVPSPTSSEQFALFAGAGRTLSDMHVGYESVEPFPALDYRYATGFDPTDPESFRVTKMRYGKVGGRIDQSTIQLNRDITVQSIPDAAHSYRLGSRSALDWLLDRYAERTDSKSGIVNDPNRGTTGIRSKPATRNQDPLEYADRRAGIVTSRVVGSQRAPLRRSKRNRGQIQCWQGLSCYSISPQ